MEPPPEPTYAQSRQSENVPRPSLPAAPPKTRVNHAFFWFARQKMEMPVSVGAMYSGNHSQTKMQMKTIQKMRLGAERQRRRATCDRRDVQPLLLEELARTAVERIEELHGRHDVRVDREGRVHQEHTHEPSHPVSKQL
jgi:hypothetical protein